MDSPRPSRLGSSSRKQGLSSFRSGKVLPSARRLARQALKLTSASRICYHFAAFWLRHESISKGIGKRESHDEESYFRIFWTNGGSSACRFLRVCRVGTNPGSSQGCVLTGFQRYQLGRLARARIYLRKYLHGLFV